jgi:hypothetical protein
MLLSATTLCNSSGQEEKIGKQADSTNCKAPAGWFPYGTLQEKQSIKSTRHMMADWTDDDPAMSPLAE